VFGTLFVPLLKLTVVLALFVIIHVVIDLYEKLQFFIYILFIMSGFAGILMIMPAAIIMSKLYDISVQFKQNFKTALVDVCLSGDNYLIMCKDLKTIQILKSRVGNFYYMQQRAKLTLVDVLANGVATMLISYRNI